MVHQAPVVSDCPSNFDNEQVVPVAGGSTADCDEREAECLHFTSRFFEDHNGENWIRCMKCL